jgi:hypothetical protein
MNVTLLRVKWLLGITVLYHIPDIKRVEVFHVGVGLVPSRVSESS